MKRIIYSLLVERSRKIGIIMLLSLVLSIFTGYGQTQTIYVYYPYAGQTVYRTTPVDIYWTSYYDSTFNVEYSFDNGGTWNEIISNYLGFEYFWTAPDTLVEQCVIRISDASDPSDFGLSGVFPIVELPAVTLVSPNGGETWNYNEIATIEWTGTNLPYYLYADYSLDDGATWNTIGYLYSDTTGGMAEVNVPYVSSDNVRVKIYDPYFPDAVFDISDNPFTIYTPPVIMYYPVAGDAIYIKSQTYINWLATGIDFVNIDLSTDNGQTWQPVDQNIDASYGYYYWTATGTPSENCVIRVSDAADPSKFGLSGLFTLLATPVITLNSPAGGEILNTNSPYTISWSYDNPNAYYLFLEYSADNGETWNYINYVIYEGIDGSYEWTTPDTESEQCLVRISDYYLGFVNDTSNLFMILTYPATPICMVTVDSTTSRNLIVWEKPVSPLINKFIVYKESSEANIYEPIGIVSYGDLSVFTDTNSNPAMKSYRYKLGFADAAGHNFPPGDFHQTIHLSINQGVGNSWNLIWSDYIGFPVSSYNIYRGASPSDMTMITSISSSFTSYSDFDAPAGNVYYIIEVVNPNGCNAALKSNVYYNSLSNIATNNTLGVNDPVADLKASIYPNPVNDRLNIILDRSVEGMVRVDMTDLVGKKVFSDGFTTVGTNSTYSISTSGLKEGIYMLKISEGSSFTMKKVVVKH